MGKQIMCREPPEILTKITSEPTLGIVAMVPDSLGPSEPI